MHRGEHNMHHRWLKTISESYEKIKLEQELVSLVEDIHKVNPTLTEQEIETFILSELKIPSRASLERGQVATSLRGLVGKLKGKIGHAILTVADKAPFTHALLAPAAAAIFGGGKLPDKATTAKDLTTAATGVDPKTVPIDGPYGSATPEGVRAAQKLSPAEQSARVASHVRADRIGHIIRRLDQRERRRTGQPDSYQHDGTPIIDPTIGDQGHSKLERKFRERAAKGLPPATAATGVQGGEVTGVTKMPMSTTPEQPSKPKPAEQPAKGGRKPRGRRAKQ